MASDPQYQTITVNGEVFYKFTNPQGKTEYSDTPPSPDQVLQPENNSGDSAYPAVCDNHCKGRIKALQEQFNRPPDMTVQMYEKQEKDKAKTKEDIEEANKNEEHRALLEEEAELAKAEEKLSAKAIAKEILLPQTKMDYAIMFAGPVLKVVKKGRTLYKIISKEKALANIQKRRREIKELLAANKAIKAKGGIVIKRKISVKISPKQLDKKAKHSLDFGVDTTKKNPNTLKEFEDAIKSHLEDSNTVPHGTYIHSPGSTVYFNKASNNVVVVDSGGNFLTGWKLDPSSRQYLDYINLGKLF